MENKNLIDKAIGFIQKNPKDNLSLQSIADNAGFSLTYFDAIFRQHTGYSPVEYSRIYKLTRSALDLRRTQKTVLDIALDFMNRRQEPQAETDTLLPRTLVLSDIQQTALGEEEFYNQVAKRIAARGVEHFIGVGPALCRQKRHFRQLQERSAYHAPQDALWCRSDR